MDEIAIGGVLLLPIVFGLTQVFKGWLKLDGAKVQVLSLAITLVFALLYYFYPMIPAPWNQYVALIVGALSVTLSTNGLYEYATRNESK